MDHQLIPIRFFYNDVSFTLKNRNQLKKYLVKIFKDYGAGLKSLNVVFCTDHYLLYINKTFLKHDYFTDTITFNLSQDKNSIEGEIYISIDRVKENASLNSMPFKQELHRVIFHSVLHLCGFNDKNQKQSRQMRLMEDKHLLAYGIKPS